MTDFLEPDGSTESNTKYLLKKKKKKVLRSKLKNKKALSSEQICRVEILLMDGPLQACQNGR